MYEPTTNIEQTVIIPLTKQTEELLGGVYSQRLHRTISKNGNGRTPVGPDVPVDNSYDLIMENVLNWSLAKKPSANESFAVDNYHTEGFVRTKRYRFHLLGPVKPFAFQVVTIST